MRTFALDARQSPSSSSSASCPFPAIMHRLSVTFTFFLLVAAAWSQQCAIGHRCHPEAACSVSQTASLGYTCLCGSGFVGNGFECFTLTAVYTGGFHTCAIISDGSVKVNTAIFPQRTCDLTLFCLQVLGQQQPWSDWRWNQG
jgi:hypothetical protein